MMNNAHKFKIPVHVEVNIRNDCTYSIGDVNSLVKDWLRHKVAVFFNGYITLDPDSASYAHSIKVVDLAAHKLVSFWQAELCLHPYRLSEQGPENDFIQGEGESLPACEQWELPNMLLHNLWDNIIVDNAMKNRLLSYCSSSIQFSDAKINPDIISWNRMILLHGPPGTGKTTILKGLAQKTFIRNSDRFQSGVLLEVNSHSLFSKWFSESGKLVMKLFSHISDIAEDEDCLVIVLIDEVESITSSRANAGLGNEPGDAVRVVNAVLTSLDALKRRTNVLVLCTSNLLDMVDSAFLDRIDLKIYLGPPQLAARYHILLSCMRELMRKGVVVPETSMMEDVGLIADELIAWCQRKQSDNTLNSYGDMHTDMTDAATSISVFQHWIVAPALDDMALIADDDGSSHLSNVPSLRSVSINDDRGTAAQHGLSPEQYLYVLASLCDGMSGRALRKLPIKAHSCYLQRTAVSPMDFISAMHATVQSER